MRNRGALAALFVTVASAQTLTQTEAALAARVERTATTGQEFPDLVMRLAENQYQQGYPWKGWQTLRAGITRARNEGKVDTAFALSMHLVSDLTDAGLFASAFAETQAAEAAGGRGLQLMHSYAACGECEEARRVKRSLAQGTGIGRSICGGVVGVDLPVPGARFTPRPGIKLEDELRERVWFARRLLYGRQPAALREHFEETVAFAERHRLKLDTSGLAEFFVEYGGDDFESYGNRILQLAGPDPAVIDRIADAWLTRGRADRAASLFEQTRNIRLAKGGPWSWSLLRSLGGLERSAIAARDWDAASGFSRESASILEVIAGPQSRILAQHLLTTAERFHVAGQTSAAHGLWDRGLHIAEQAYGQHSRMFADALKSAAKPAHRAGWAQRAEGIRTRFPDPQASWRVDEP